MLSNSVAHRVRYLQTCARTRLTNARDRLIGSPAASFYDNVSSGFNAEAHIDVLPAYNLIYVSLPKCASTTIKSFLARLNTQTIQNGRHLHTRRISGIPSPIRAGLSNFYRVAKNPASLRFTFVRNPFARLVSAWADKFSDQKLDSGDPYVKQYLSYMHTTGEARPATSEHGLSFDAFAHFACATATKRLNSHWNLQHDLIDFPGLELNVVGRVENFAADFARVLDQLGPFAHQCAHVAITRHNRSRHLPWRQYYTPEIAKIVAKAYERDFDRFGYSSRL
jgi:hypothetical protein